MSDVAICVEQLSKRYRIGQRLGSYQYRTLRESVSHAIATSFRRMRSTFRRPDGENGKRPPAHTWALLDLSLSVRCGEVVGIIGRNGAGKSTLLKILSRITKPTKGYAELNGRVGSLLEVGTGFHPELSGRDNIYLNGAILGMRWAEINRRFDEIVDFAGVAKFIDTPVKHYSSGMYVRLAFAVAAHLEPEILLVDEVLAVGDVEFQKRCLGKMRSVVKEGRTVMFVSHNLAAVKALCRRAVLLDAGRLVAEGSVDSTIDAYLRRASATACSSNGAISETADRIGTGEARFRAVELLDLSGQPVAELYLGQPFRLAMTVDVMQPVADAVVEVGISALDGTRVTTSFTVDHAQPVLQLSQGRYRFCLDLDPWLLPRGYMVDVGICHLSGGLVIDMLERVLDFIVMNVSETGFDSYFPTEVRGFIRPNGSWRAPERVDFLGA